MKGRYLDGELLPLKTIADRRRLIGKRVQYLRLTDIDKSGRGYFFPRIGRITAVEGRNIFFDGAADWSPNIWEMIELPPND